MTIFYNFKNNNMNEKEFNKLKRENAELKKNNELISEAITYKIVWRNKIYIWFRAT